jgi:phage terminase small subunit
MTEVPVPPVALDERAARLWSEYAPVLASRSAARPSDWSQLAAYCLAASRWQAAEEWLQHPDHGPVLTIRDDKGNVKSHGPDPHLRIAETSLKEMGRLAKTLRL